MRKHNNTEMISHLMLHVGAGLTHRTRILYLSQFLLATILWFCGANLSLAMPDGGYLNCINSGSKLVLNETLSTGEWGPDKQVYIQSVVYEIQKITTCWWQDVPNNNEYHDGDQPRVGPGFNGKGKAIDPSDLECTALNKVLNTSSPKIKMLQESIRLTQHAIEQEKKTLGDARTIVTALTIPAAQAEYACKIARNKWESYLTKLINKNCVGKKMLGKNFSDCIDNLTPPDVKDTKGNLIYITEAVDCQKSDTLNKSLNSANKSVDTLKRHEATLNSYLTSLNKSLNLERLQLMAMMSEFETRPCPP